jgi:hypothetical protein
MALRVINCSIFLLLCLCLPWRSDAQSSAPSGEESTTPENSPTLEKLAPFSDKVSEYYRAEQERSRVAKYSYSYPLKSYKARDSLTHIGWVYLLTWAVYPLTQPETVREKGSLSLYRRNFGQLVFDQDEPFWNWFVHPLSGSQLFLLYRSLGYTRPQSMGMSFVSSTLFELTVEIYTEPASVQDLYQTPVLGAVLGVGIENLSLYLLNTGNPMGKFFGHLINPATLFWFYEGKVLTTPIVGKDKTGMLFMAEF